MASQLPARRQPHNADVESSRAFLETLFPAPRSFDIRLWDGSILPGLEPTRFTLTIRSPGTLRRMLQMPFELKSGEAYIRGDFDIEGGPFALVEALYMAARAGLFNAVGHIDSAPNVLGQWTSLLRGWLALPSAESSSPQLARLPARLTGKPHSRERERLAVAYHYNVGNDFYKLWLDQLMIYSGAYFPIGTEDINAAQEAKLDYVCRKLHLKPGEYLLDIGCGWGGMLIYAAQHYGICGYGVTLSPEQHEFASQRVREAGLSRRVTVRLMDYRDIKGETFDKIVSIAMFEHMGLKHLPEYFHKVYDLLQPGGLFMVQGSSAGNNWRRSSLEWLVDRFLFGRFEFGRRYVFPDGEVHPVSQTNLIAERAGFEVRDVESIREHMVLTLRQWIERLYINRDEAIRLSNDTAFRIWYLYLSVSLFGFESGTVAEFQSLLTKPTGSPSNLPLTRAGLYSK